MSLTSVNCVIMLSVSGVFPSPQQLQEFSTDDVFDVEQVKIVETQMGVDGVLSGGLVYNEVSQTFTLQSNSPSVFLFDQWVAAQFATNDVFSATETILLPGLQTAWNGVNGFLTDYPPMPSVGKLVKPRKYTVKWQSLTPAPI